jgi:hypothetical protein
MPNDYKSVNGVRVQLTDAEQSVRNAEITEFNTGAFDRELEQVRAKRNRLLAETDHLALSDNTLSDAMATYRTELRDITEGLTTVADIDALVFPTKPSE